MTAQTILPANAPAFCAGMFHFGEAWPNFAEYGRSAAIAAGHKAISNPAATEAVYQTLLMADALRYCTLQICAAKSSGHPGGFASSAEAYAALVMLGHTNIVTEVGHEQGLVDGFRSRGVGNGLVSGGDGGTVAILRKIWPLFTKVEHARAESGRVSGQNGLGGHGVMILC